MRTLGELVSMQEMRYVEKGLSLLSVVNYMSEHKVGAVPVLDGGRLIGIFSERDLMVRCVAGRLDIEKTMIEDVMTKRVIIMDAGDTYGECLQIMKQEDIRHVPVRDGDKLVGVVSMRDIMKADVEEKEQKIEILHSYIHYNPKGKTKE
jgi:CBS domain-containing protein